jgi:hypothetical protein
LGGIAGALLALPLAAALLMLIDELRLDLPGDDTDDRSLKQRDAKAEQAYAKESAGASPEEAATMATRIADQIREADGVDPNDLPPVPITDGKTD